MIKNNLCRNCQHLFVCDKLKTLCKFDDENKGYIGVDITMNKCMDYMGPEQDGAHE